MLDPDHAETLTHRLILPRDTNHHGTLYAGTLLSLALEAGYAAAFRSVGAEANLVLKRVLDLRCYEPVPTGFVIEIRARELKRARAQVIIGLYGSPLPTRTQPWMDGLMQFAQVDSQGRPSPLEGEPVEVPQEWPEPWQSLQLRSERLRNVRR